MREVVDAGRRWVLDAGRDPNMLPDEREGADAPRRERCNFIDMVERVSNLIVLEWGLFYFILILFCFVAVLR